MRFIFHSVLISTLVLASCGGGGSSESNEPIAQLNRAPTIVSANEAFFPQTLTGMAYTIVGSDPDGDQLSYSISGEDAEAFLVNDSTGEISFLTTPDVDDPMSADGDNFYVINAIVSDPSQASDSKRVDIEVVRHDPQGPFLFIDGAVYLGPDTITETDPSSLQTLNFFTTTRRVIPDNRVGNDTDTEIRIYEAIYTNGQRIEMVVNTEISPETEAESKAQHYARILGQLDPTVTAGIENVWIHPGNATITGPVGGVVVHTGFAEDELIPRNVLEEVIAHEAIHATLDPIYLRSSEWHFAQKSDISFISQYARDFAETEDLAESYGAYLIVKNASRNPASLVQTIQEGIPQRLLFFESLGL